MSVAPHKRDKRGRLGSGSCTPCRGLVARRFCILFIAGPRELEKVTLVEWEVWSRKDQDEVNGEAKWQATAMTKDEA